MSLFVKIDVGFWQHRKTLRLRAKIGDAAFWVPPRLWSYAAQNQPDGDFSDYSPEEISSVIGYSGNAKELLEALQQALLMDGMCIHSWSEHNGYHTVFAERAKKAASVRWERERSKEKSERGEERRREETSNASSMDGFACFWAEYPKKKAKADAEKAWKQMKCNPILSRILSAVESALKTDDWRREGGKFIPYPGTWLRAGQWDDEETVISSVPNIVYFESPLADGYMERFRAKIAAAMAKPLPEK